MGTSGGLILNPLVLTQVLVLLEAIHNASTRNVDLLLYRRRRGQRAKPAIHQSLATAEVSAFCVDQ